MTVIPVSPPHGFVPSVDRALEWGFVGCLFLGAVSVINWVVWAQVHRGNASFWYAVSAILSPVVLSLLLGLASPPEWIRRVESGSCPEQGR